MSILPGFKRVKIAHFMKVLNQVFSHTPTTTCILLLLPIHVKASPRSVPSDAHKLGHHTLQSAIIVCVV